MISVGLTISIIILHFLWSCGFYMRVNQLRIILHSYRHSICATSWLSIKVPITPQILLAVQNLYIALGNMPRFFKI